MTKPQSARERERESGNQLLDRLPEADYQRLYPRFKPVRLKFKQVLYETRSPIDAAYFPIRGVLSAVAVMKDGGAIEVANIGNEGMVGSPALIEAKYSPNRVFVQVEGDGLQIAASVLMDEIRQNSSLRNILLRYHTAFLSQVSQSVACNGLHPVKKRCCRWLLMTHDRVNSDELLLTHELLGIMLGVRRASVTEVLQSLQKAGLIQNGRGKITILKRDGLEAASCECYRSVTDEFGRLLG
jgi:CRP-like cAMP-binding protein